MANLGKCKDCGKEVSRSAETCPNCGVKNPAGGIGQTQFGCGGILALLFLGFIFWVFGRDYSTSEAPSSTPKSTVTLPGAAPPIAANKRYLHKTANVRNGPGTDHEVLRQLTRGATVTVQKSEDGWSMIGDNEWVSDTLLEQSPIPPLEIASWNWRADPDFGTRGVIKWTVELRNNTDRYIESVRVDFATYDSSDKIITSTFAFVRGLRPGGTSSEESYATYFGNEDTARISVAAVR